MIGTTRFFQADDGAHGPELWTSDGSPAGTELVEDLWLGGNGSTPTDLTLPGSTLLFADSGQLVGNEPFRYTASR